jgi:hypothetical protein
MIFIDVDIDLLPQIGQYHMSAYLFAIKLRLYSEFRSFFVGIVVSSCGDSATNGVVIKKPILS